MKAFLRLVTALITVLLPRTVCANQMALITGTEGDASLFIQGQERSSGHETYYRGYEKGARLDFLQTTVIDEVRIQTSPGRKITYFLGYDIEGTNNGSWYNTDAFNVVADSRGIQSMPVRPPLETKTLVFMTDNENVKSVSLYNKGEKIAMQSLEVVEADVKASSTLKPERVYAVNNLFDDDLDSIWAEGAEGYGAGEAITFSFKEEIPLTEIFFFNGHQRNSEIFRRNGRLKDFTITDDQGNSGAYQLENRMGLQRVVFRAPIKTSTVRLTITSAYPGTKYSDLCLSEIGFLSHGKVISVHPSDQMALAKRNQELLEKTGITHFGLSKWGTRGLEYDPETSRFKYIMYSNESPYFSESDGIKGTVCSGVAEVKSATKGKVKIYLEGYLDQAILGRYADELEIKSRIPVAMDMTVVRPYYISKAERTQILKQRGIGNSVFEKVYAYEQRVEANKKRLEAKDPSLSQQEIKEVEEYDGMGPVPRTFEWYISQLGFHEDYYEETP